MVVVWVDGVEVLVFPVHLDPLHLHMLPHRSPLAQQREAHAALCVRGVVGEGVRGARTHHEVGLPFSIGEGPRAGEWARRPAWSTGGQRTAGGTA
jgi:hypothetical protein